MPVGKSEIVISRIQPTTVRICRCLLKILSYINFDIGSHPTLVTGWHLFNQLFPGITSDKANAAFMKLGLKYIFVSVVPCPHELKKYL